MEQELMAKTKSLFDHIRQITSVQQADYWDTLSDGDKKTWSNYMIHRFLSMKMEWVELVNELQKYNLESKDLYKLYTNVLPKGKQWLKYIKGEKQMEHPSITNRISMLSSHGDHTNGAWTIKT